jgi:hypothetical membrane protein
MPVRLAAACGLLAPLTYTAALVFGGLAQPDAFSSADDNISDLGAAIASSSWIYNRAGTNLTGILLFAFALGLWRALSPEVVGRLGAGLLAVPRDDDLPRRVLHARLPRNRRGLREQLLAFRAQGIVSGISAALFFLVPLTLAVAFRRNPQWRNSWIPTLAAAPAVIVASIGFSVIGDGAATRAGAVVWFLWLGFVAFRLLQNAETGGVRTEV